ncbi:MAG: PKD domain-containing protein [Bacteroidota bacterium]
MNRRNYLFSLLLLVLPVIGLAQPTAIFTATPVSGCSPLVVQFTDQSTGPVTSWFWDFGNGNTSTLQNPAAVYVTPGTYTVTLTVSDGPNSDTQVQTNLITVFQDPTANFTNASPTNGCVPHTVCFTDQSTPGDGAINSWIWDFGDGNTSTAQNPCHTYTATGSFTVTLVATDVNGCSNTFTIPNYVNVSTTPTAAFTGTPLSACGPPLTVNFTNNSSGGQAPLNYQWDFGDGNTSTQPNPSNTYTTSGSYTVTLITTDNNGCADTLVQNAYVNISSVTAAFTQNTTNICEGQGVTFTDQSTGATQWNWDFGDGGTSTQQNPTHTYATAGTYTVTLIASNGGQCPDTIVQTNLITVNPAPTANFVADTTTSCEVPFVVNFTDLSTSNPVNWAWDFGDGNTATAQNPTHTYTVPGTYNVTLTVTDANGCTGTVTFNNYIQIVPPVADFIGAPLNGCVPLTVNFTDQSTSNEPIVSWQWDFGDGNTSTVQNPTHIYTAVGAYTVTLIIINSAGCTDTLVRPLYIQVGDIPEACFTYNPDSACVNDIITFTDCSINATSWFWQFGDGGTSNAQNPTYAYQDTGCFTVTLTVANFGCVDDTVITNAVCISPPLAQFQLNPAQGCAVPHTVFFTDQSILPDTWFWDFGDGNTSSLQNPVHTYTATGTFNVTLVVADTITGCTDQATAVVTVSVPTADFTGGPLFGCGPLTVNFVDNSTANLSPIVGWAWDFGDGNNSNQQNPTHTFQNPGTYTVTLTVTDANGCTDTRTRTNYVQVIGPDVNFGADTLIGCDSLLVNFSDSTIATAPITGWTWDFGDGNTSNQQNPTHFYTTTGTFTVSLTVTDIDGCTRTFTRNNYIFINSVNAGFTVDDTLSCAGGTFNFTNNSTGVGLNYLWDFGDGNTSTATNPSHTYTANGSYTVSLFVFDNNNLCRDTIIDSNLIDIQDIIANFGAAPTTASCPPLLVNFTDSSSFDIVSWQWDFGDGTGSTLQNPGHVYTQAGSYDVTLIVTNNDGCIDTLFVPGLINLDGPNGNFTFAPDTGCTPQLVNFNATATNTASYTWDFGDGNVAITTVDSVQHTYTQTGTFFPILILDDGLGCTFSVISPDSIVIDTIPLVDFSVANTTICGIDSAYFTDLTVSTRPITSWFWDFGDGTTDSVQNPVHLYPGPGSYTVTLAVVNSLGCTDTLVRPAEIDILVPPTAAFTPSDTIGCLPLLVNYTDNSTGNQPITAWNWDFGTGATSIVQNPSANLTLVGTFPTTLIVTDSAGCMDTTVRNITVNPGPTAFFTADNPVGCPPHPVNFTANTGQGIVQFDWDFGDGNTGTGNPVAHTYTASGNYTVTLVVTDTLGCMDTLVRNQYININPPIANFTQTNTSGCPPLTVTFTDNSTGTNTIVNYAWDFGDGNTGTGTPVSHTYTTPGTFSVTLIITDNVGCMDTLLKPNLVTVFEPPLAGFEIVDTLNCLPFTIELADTSISANSTIVAWAWDFGDGGTSAAQNPIHAYQNPGPFTISLTVTDANGCTGTATFPFVVPTLPVANFVASDSLGCPPLTTTFTADSAGIALFEWDFGDGSPVAFGNPITHTYTTAGSFTVTLIVEDSIGCRDTLVRPQYININPPTADFNQNNTSGCPPLTVTFTDNSTNQYPIVNWAWDFGDGNTGTGAPVTHTYANPGVYSVTLIVTDSLGCMDTIVKPNLITVFEPPVAGFAFVDTLNCVPFTIELGDTSTSANSTIVAWDWDFGDGGSSAAQNPIHAYQTPGPYTITLIVTDANGCRDTTTTPFIAPPPPVATFTASDSIGCPPLTTTFTGGTAGGIVFWEWDFGDGSPAAFGNPITHTYTAAGNFTVTLIVEDSIGCRDTLVRPQYITINPPVADFTQNNTSGCPPLTVTFNDNSTTQYPIVAWNWDFGDGNTGTGAPVTHTYTTPGIYTVTLIITDSVGCQDTIAKPNLIEVFAPPTAAFGIVDTVACEPFTIELGDSSSGVVAVTGWDWDFGDGNTSTLQNPVHGYQNPGPYTITLIITDANGCRDTSAIPFEVPVRPAANFTVNDSLGCSALDVIFTADSVDVVSWTWDFGDGNGATTGPTVSHFYPNRGSYSVTLITEDIYGCFDTLTRPNYIFVDSTAADFIFDQTVGCPPTVVNFTDQSYSDTTIVSWQWNFGDGSQQFIQNPSHTYITPGSYTVTLIVTNAIGCTDTIAIPTIDIFDQFAPGVPPILMATVESNTTDSISWLAYSGADFSHYVLYWETPTGSNIWTPIDSFFNVLDTTYTHVGLNTLDNSYCYKLQVVDVCGFRSSLDSSRTHCTIDLEAAPGLDQAILTWTPYVGWDSVAFYNVYRVSDYNQANAQLIGSVVGGITTYIDSAVVCYEDYCYRVQAIQQGGFLETAWSDTSCATPIHIAAPLPLDMCSASVVGDSAVQLTWTVPPGLEIASIFLEKSTDGQTFGQIAVLNPTQTAFFDLDVRVQDQSYYYRISYIDSCGDLSPYSNLARTIVLDAEMQNAPNLNWNQYEEWPGGILNSRIEVLNDLTRAWEFVDVTPETILSYIDNLTSFDQPIYCYRVSAEENGGGCRSVSNIACVPVGPTLFAPNAFTPNGDDLNETFELKGVYIADYNLQIFDRWGSLIFESNSLDVQWDGRWRDRPCQEGAYVWVANARGFDGTVIQRRGTVTLLR